jgi:cell division protein FtsQ
MAAGSEPQAEATQEGGADRRAVDPWRVAFFGLLIAAVLGAGGWVVLGPNVLVVRREEVIGNRTIPAAEVLAAAAVRRGTPLRSVDTGAVARRIERIPQVLAAAVGRSWPDTLVITISLRTPALAVAEPGRQYALIDSHGVTVRLSSYRPAGMPLLLEPPARLPGSPGVRSAVTILRELPRSLRSLIETVTAPADNAVSFGLRGGITVVWGGPALTAKKAAELAVLLTTQARYYDVSDPTTAVTQR